MHSIRVDDFASEWESIRFPHGAVVEGQDANDIVEIMVAGSKDAIDANKKLLVKTLDEIEASNKFVWGQLGYIAAVFLLAGIALHAVAEATGPAG